MIPLCGEHTAKVRNELKSQDKCDFYGSSEIRIKNSIKIVNRIEVAEYLTNPLM